MRTRAGEGREIGDWSVGGGGGRLGRPDDFSADNQPPRPVG